MITIKPKTMIKPNELRLLNWVKLNDEDLFCKVLVIDKFGLSVDIVKTKEITWIEYEQFSPVELTPDILEAAGFGVNKDNSFGYINENEGILIELGDFYEDDGRAVFYYNLPDTDNSTCIAYCKYLHQLQNLYFALTGDELQIDITKLNK